MGKLLYEKLSYQIRGVLYEVYNSLGPGFREETYKQAVIAELHRQNVLVKREVEIPITYKNEVIDRYRLDLVVDEKVILELKAVDELHPRHAAQLLSYLRASDLKLGLLVNFRSNELVIKRYAHERPPASRKN